MTVPWPAANAMLLDLRAPGGLDDSGDATGAAGAQLWAGALEAVLSRERRTVISGGQNTPVELDVLVIRKPPEAVAKARPGDQTSGQTVLVRDRRTPTSVESRFRIVKAEHRGRGEAESVRFELADERTP